MAALISGNCADVGAIDENCDGGSAGSADVIGARGIPLFDLIGDLGEPIDDGPMIVWSSGRYKEIKYTGGFSKREPSSAGIRSNSGTRSCRLSAGTTAKPSNPRATNTQERTDHSRSIIMNPTKAVAVVTFSILLTGFARLKPCQLLLQTALYRLPSSRERPNSSSRAPLTMRSTTAISRRCETPSVPTNSTRTFILDCAATECPFRQKAPATPKFLPPFFRTPMARSESG